MVSLMKTKIRRWVSGILYFCYGWSLVQPTPDFTQREVIYARKVGMALTMVLLTPRGKPNGKEIVSQVSGAGHSSYESILGVVALRFYLSRGYTVLAVLHSPAPKYTLTEVFPDLQRTVRFIRYYAAEYAIDPDHIGITGESGGVHLALLVATAGEGANPTAEDPIDRVSSRVQAVAQMITRPPIFSTTVRRETIKYWTKPFGPSWGAWPPFNLPPGYPVVGLTASVPVLFSTIYVKQHTPVCPPLLAPWSGVLLRVGD
jgi:acetyl esterase/lipase